MNKRLTGCVLLASLPFMALTGCLDIERPDPIMLEGRNTFPSDPSRLRNEYNYTLAAEYHDADGVLQADDSFSERGSLFRSYEEVTGSELVSPLYQVRDRWIPQTGTSRELYYWQGFQDPELHFAYYKDVTGELVDGDSGLPLFWAQLAVGHSSTGRMWYEGDLDRWQVYVEIEILRTEIIETDAVDVETYLVRLRGDDEDDERYTGSDDFRLSWFWWVSPELGIVGERKVVFERDEHGNSVRRTLETDLRRYRG